MKLVINCNIKKMIQVTEGVINGINHILDANISASSERDSSANSSSIILQLVEVQIEQTLAEHVWFESIKPNIIVEGVTVNATTAVDGVDFEIERTDSGFRADDNGSDKTSIRLPKDALSVNTGKNNQRYLKIFLIPSDCCHIKWTN